MPANPNPPFDAPKSVQCIATLLASTSFLLVVVLSAWVSGWIIVVSPLAAFITIYSLSAIVTGRVPDRPISFMIDVLKGKSDVNNRKGGKK